MLRTLLRWFQRWVDSAWKADKHTSTFQVFCPYCHQLLNTRGVDPVDSRQGVYTWQCCRCGSLATFDHMTPVPILVSKHKALVDSC